MRVIAGTARGIVLTVPRGRATRPITDRVKETLFAILGDRVVDARAVDLYAGSGAIGIEALSRGAERVDFVERDRSALAAIRANLERTRLADAGTVHASEVERFLGSSATRWTLAFLDPPYESHDMVAALLALRPHLEPGATVVIKHFWRAQLPEMDGQSPARQRRFGETMLSFLEVDGA